MLDDGGALPDLLARRLAAAPDVEAACEVAVEHLARDGLLVSAYLRQGDRMRCRGIRGYWQIYDGMPLGAGVIGRTVRTGVRQLVRGVHGCPDYLPAVAGVVDELCVPLCVEGVVVGVLNVESSHPLTAGQEADGDLTASLLQQRLQTLPMPLESPAQRLGRHAAALAALAGHADPGALHRAVLAAARDISGTASALLLLVGPDGLTPTAAAGPLAGPLLALSADSTAAVARWVQEGTTTYTVGSVGGLGFAGSEQLRATGLQSMICLPLGTGRSHLGMLLVCSASQDQVWPEDVELLELLAAAVLSCLQVSASVVALRRRAERDPLTGLGHHAAFHALLGPARGDTADLRLAVLYIDVDHFKSVNDTLGHAAGDGLLLAISALMHQALRERDRLFRIGGDEFAVLAEVSTAEQADALGARLLEAVHDATGATLSIGVAVEEPGESDAALLARADAALYAAKASGRGCVRVGPPPRCTPS